MRKNTPIRPVSGPWNLGGFPLLAGIGRVGVRSPGVLLVVELGEEGPPREERIETWPGWELVEPEPEIARRLAA